MLRVVPRSPVLCCAKQISRTVVHGAVYIVRLTKMPPKSSAVKFNELEKLQTNLSSEGKLLATAMQKELAKMKQDYTKMIADKDSVIEDLQQQVAAMRTDIDSLQERARKMEDNIDGADAYERRDTIVLSGPSLPVASAGENCVAKAIDVIKEKLKVQIAVNDISTAHRLGTKPQNQAPDNRKLIVKLCRRDVKRNIRCLLFTLFGRFLW